MSADTAILIVAMILIFITVMTFAVIVFTALRDVSRANERDAARHDAQIERLLDRLTTIRWEDFAALTAIQSNDEEGGFLTPEEQATEAKVAIEEPGRWGPLSRAARRQDLTETEEALLAEDFPTPAPERPT